MKLQQGMVLVTSLIICLLLSILIFSSMGDISLENKLMSSFINKKNLFYRVEKKSQDIIYNFKNHQKCISDEQDINYYFDLKLPFKCMEEKNNINLSYVIEDLGVFPCLKIKVHQQLFSSHLYRINLKSNLEKQQVSLQIVFAEQNEDTQNSCESLLINTINLGKLSWRIV